MIRIAIVEDEEIFTRQMLEFMERYQKERGITIKTTVFTDGDGIVDHYQGGFDIIFMDIQMPFLDGMTAAEMIRQQDPEVIIIFITNMSQYAIRGYAVGALDYVLKPISYFALSQRMDKALARMKKREARYLVLSTSDGVRKLDLSRLRYIESQNHRLIFHTMDEEFAAATTMQKMEKELTEEGGFFRCGKGYLVNLEHVDAIRDNCAIVGGASIPISRGRKAPLMTALTDYVSGVRK